MWVRQVDDQHDNEGQPPAFQVFFWEPLRSSGSYTVEAWEIWDATTEQLRAWVRRNAAGRTVSAWALSQPTIGPLRHERLALPEATPLRPEDDTDSGWPQ